MQLQARNISTRHARRIIVRTISNFSNIFSLLALINIIIIRNNCE